MNKKTKDLCVETIEQAVNTLSLNEVEEMLFEYDSKFISITIYKIILSTFQKKKILNSIVCDKNKTWKERCSVIKNLNDVDVLYKLISSEDEEEVIRSAAASRILALELETEN